MRRTPRNPTVISVTSAPDGHECDYCYLCGIQEGGSVAIEPPNYDGPWWDEIDNACTPDFYPEQYCGISGPTTSDGDEAEGGDTSITTGEPVCEDDPDPEQLEVWICNGSAELMGSMIQGPDPEDVVTSSVSGGNLPVCVNASSEDSARCECQDYCTNKNDAQQYNADVNDWMWNPYDCDALFSWPLAPVMATNIITQCQNQMVMPSAAPFVGDADLEISDAGTASIPAAHGIIDFHVGPCSPPASTCALTVRKISVDAPFLQGEFVADGEPQPSSITINDLAIHSVQSITGIIVRNSGAVYFPRGNDLLVNVSSGPILLGGSGFIAGIEDSLYILPAKTWDVQVLVAVANMPLIVIQILLGQPSGYWDGQELTLKFDLKDNENSAKFRTEFSTY
jgi:hypothetical protein